MRKKKILIFSTAYYPFVGGAEVAVKEITDRLGDGFEFDMITARINNELPRFEKIGNISVYRVGFSLGSQKNKILRQFTNFFYIIFGFLKANLLGARNKYDITWSVMAAYAGAIGLFFKVIHPKIPLLLTLQEGDDFAYIKARLGGKNSPLWRRLFVGWYREPIWRFLFRKSDYIQCISNYLAQWTKKMGATCPTKVIPNGVDTARFSQTYSEAELDELKGKLGKQNNDKFLITTSRLVKKNAVDDVIKSLKFLPENIKFIILGNGPDRKMLERLVKTEGVADKIIFLGLIDHKKMPKYLKVSDIFIRPSLSEGMGNSFVEAMAVGLPVIATQEGGIADFLFDATRNPSKEATGWAVNPRDPRGIAEAVKDILDNSSKTVEVIATAKKMVFEKYDWDIVAKDMREKVFAKLFSIKQ